MDVEGITTTTLLSLPSRTSTTYLPYRDYSDHRVWRIRWLRRRQVPSAAQRCFDSGVGSFQSTADLGLHCHLHDQSNRFFTAASATWSFDLQRGLFSLNFVHGVLEYLQLRENHIAFNVYRPVLSLWLWSLCLVEKLKQCLHVWKPAVDNEIDTP